MGRGAGFLNTNLAFIPPAAPTVTAANEGLSLSGTTVQLGNASILSALPTITATRHIPIAAGIVIQLNSSNIALPANLVQLGSTGILLRTNTGVTAPTITLNDATIPTTVLINHRSLSITSAGGVNTPFITITGVAGAVPTLTLTNGTNTSIQTNQNIIITTPSHATPSFVAVGTNAAGSVFASQFRNTSVAAAASVLSQWYIDSSVQDFQIAKYSNANAASGNPGGIDLIHTNAGVPASMLRLVVASSTGILRGTIGSRVNLEFDGAGIYTIGDVNTSVNGTVVRVEDVSSLVRINGNNGLIVQSVAGQVWSQTTTAGLTLGVTGTNIGRLHLAGNTSGLVSILPQAAAGTYNFNLPITAGAAGDILTSGGGGAAPMTFTALAALTGLPYIALTGASTATGNISVVMGANSFLVQATAGNNMLELNPGGATYKMGDIAALNNGTFINVNDATGELIISASIGAGGGLMTGPGATAGAGVWRFGSVQAGASVVDAANYVEVDIGGSLVKLAIIV